MLFLLIRRLACAHYSEDSRRQLFIDGRWVKVMRNIGLGLLDKCMLLLKRTSRLKG